MANRLDLNHLGRHCGCEMTENKPTTAEALDNKPGTMGQMYIEALHAWEHAKSPSDSEDELWLLKQSNIKFQLLLDGVTLALAARCSVLTTLGRGVMNLHGCS